MAVAAAAAEGAPRKRREASALPPQNRRVVGAEIARRDTVVVHDDGSVIGNRILFTDTT